MAKKTNAVLIHHADNVVTATESLEAGGVVRYRKGGEVVEIIVREGIPKFHKIAVMDIPKSRQVFKYGQVIGVALKVILKGSHVHDHNIESPPQDERMG
jgi:SAF domain